MYCDLNSGDGDLYTLQQKNGSLKAEMSCSCVQVGKVCEGSEQLTVDEILP